MKKIILLSIITFTFCLGVFGQTQTGSVNSSNDTKISAEQLIAKHLKSIGSAEDLAAAKSIVTVGNGRLTSKIGYAGQLTGPAQFASEGNKILFAMIFNSIDYPYEKGAFDGKDISVGISPQGNRSLLGDFLKSHSAVLKQGIFGGVLSSAWLLRGDNVKGEFEYAGLEKVGDRQLYRLKFSPSKGGTLRVSLYFEPETFRHIMTEYQYIVSPKIGPSPTSNAGQREQRYTLVETFSDFAVAGKLTLPRTYQIDLTVYTGATQSLQWLMKFSDFYFNESIGVEAFKVS